MRFTQTLGLLLAGLILFSAAGATFVLAKIDAGDHAKTQAYDRSNELVLDANVLTGSARSEIAHLEGYLGGTSTWDAVNGSRASFHDALADTRSLITSAPWQDPEAIALLVDQLARVEQNLTKVATTRGDVEVSQLHQTWETQRDLLFENDERAAEALTALAPTWEAAHAALDRVASHRAGRIEFEHAVDVDMGLATSLSRGVVADGEALLAALAQLMREEMEGAAAHVEGSDAPLATKLRSAAASVDAHAAPPDVEALMEAAGAQGAPRRVLPTGSATLLLGRAFVDAQASARTWPAYVDTSFALQRYAGRILGADSIGVTTTSQALLSLAQEEAESQKRIGAAQLADARVAAAVTVAIVSLPVAASGAVFAFRLRARLREFDEAAAAVGRGAFAQAKPKAARDDFDKLAAAWTKMVDDIQARDRDLVSRNAHLRQNERMASLGSLVAGVAHEVNNPLAFIKSNEEMSLADVEGLQHHPSLVDHGDIQTTLSGLQETLQTNLDGIGRIERINKALKGFAAPSKEKRELVDLNDVVEGALLIAHNRLKNRFRIVRQYGSLPHVRVSPQEIGQVVLNLVINAAEAAPERSTITIQTQAKEDSATISVLDDGPGVPPDMQDRLFQAFSTSKPTGTGLGLHISRQIAEAHGGTLALAASARGAQFILALPIQERAPVQVTPP